VPGYDDPYRRYQSRTARNYGLDAESEAQVTDDPGTAAGFRADVFPAGLAAAEAGLRLHGSLDIAEITRLVLDATVPGFADAATMFISDQLTAAEGAPRPGGNGPATARRLGTRLAHRNHRVHQDAFPAGETIAFDADSPYGRCLHLSEPVVFTEADRRTLEQVHPEARALSSRYASFLAVPVTAGGRAAGFLAFARTASRAAFGETDTAAAARLAAATGAGISSALTLLREQSLSGTLLRSLLAAEPPPPLGIEAAARCLPTAGHVIGGDWYDVLPLAGGRTGLIVGDVMGHGPEAAAVMAQLRTAAHALALAGLEPAELLGHLDRATITLRRPVLATCVYAVIDPAARTCILSAAGHLPPVLAWPDGATRVPDLPAGQSLGLGTAVYGQARIKFPPGTIIALYTDGLVETRTRSFDQGITALRTILASRADPLETACDAIIASLAERSEDDVTLILARIPR
jgi:GAF domain-containing protein